MQPLIIRRNNVCYVLVAVCVFLAWLLWPRPPRHEHWRHRHAREYPVPVISPIDKAVVMAVSFKDDIEWVSKLDSGWKKFLYTAVQPPEPGFHLRPSVYRGREATVYLDYIISNYDALPATTAFLHANDEQWHNDLLGPATLPLLQNLRFDSVQRLGYMNLRCAHHPGCPFAVNPHSPSPIDIERNDTRAFFADLYVHLFDLPGKSHVPEHLAHPCCGQFAVSRAQIRKRPLSDYERMRKWIWETDLPSHDIGWVFENIWHVIFGMDPMYCPPIEQCRCDLLGWCGPLPTEPDTSAP